MKKIEEIALVDMISGINKTSTALNPYDEIRVKTYLRALYANKQCKLDIYEVQTFLKNNNVMSVKQIIKFINEKNKGKMHRGIDHSKFVTPAALMKKWRIKQEESDDFNREQIFDNIEDIIKSDFKYWKVDKQGNIEYKGNGGATSIESDRLLEFNWLTHELSKKRTTNHEAEIEFYRVYLKALCNAGIKTITLDTSDINKLI